MKTITLNTLKTRVFLFALSLIFMSCTNYDGGTPQLCADYNFYGLRINDFNNCGNRLLVLSNGRCINKVQENLRIWELEIANSPNAGTVLDSSSFTDVFLGMVY